MIELSDTSLRYDRNVKLPGYAQTGVPEVWIIDLGAGQIEVFRSPRGATYDEHVVYGADARLGIPGRAQIAVTEILPAEMTGG